MKMEEYGGSRLSNPPLLPCLPRQDGVKGPCQVRLTLPHPREAWTAHLVLQTRMPDSECAAAASASFNAWERERHSHDCMPDMCTWRMPCTQIQTDRLSQLIRGIVVCHSTPWLARIPSRSHLDFKALRTSDAVLPLAQYKKMWPNFALYFLFQKASS
jgi:hypothetical protein